MQSLLHDKVERPAVTVIIPVYNVELYLCECLESVCNQTLPDIEIICVNDGSTDSSLAILQDFATRDARISVFSKENDGQATARNYALEHARGDFIYFLDSDDKIELNTFERLVPIMIEENLDSILFNRKIFYQTEELKKQFSASFDKCMEFHADYSTVQTGLELFANMSAHSDYSVSPCLRLIRRSFLEEHHLRFPEGIIHEDELFFCQCDTLTRRTKVIDYPFFNRRVRTNSTMTQPKGEANFVGYMCAFTGLVHFWHTQEIPEQYQQFITKRLNSLLDAARKIQATDNISSSLDWRGNRIAEELYPFLLPQPLSRKNPFRYYRRKISAPEVSVIIPVFNTAPFLYECLTSIQAQTLEEFEIICLDDGSTDASLPLLHFFAQADSRIKVLTQKNKGAGAARNLAMEDACGRYLLFLDSDDFIEKTMLKEMVQKAETDAAEITVCRFYRFDHSSQKNISSSYLSQKLLNLARPVSYRDLPEHFFTVFQHAPWNKLFLREFVQKHGLLFQELPRANDVRFVDTALICAERISLLNLPLLYYRKGQGTNLQARNSLTPTAFYLALKSLKEKLQEIGKFDDVELGYANAALSSCLYNLFSLSDFDAFSQLYNQLRSEIFNECHIDRFSEQQLASKADFKKYQMIMQEEMPFRFLLNQYHQFNTENIALKNEINQLKSKQQERKQQEHKPQERKTAWLVRKTKGGICCLRENGIYYTLRHGCGKIIRKLRR